MLDKSKRYLIVGLGLLGGKYALELTGQATPWTASTAARVTCSLPLTTAISAAARPTILRTWCKALTTSFSRFTPPP